jgi:hypothetical protein
MFMLSAAYLKNFPVNPVAYPILRLTIQTIQNHSSLSGYAHLAIKITIKNLNPTKKELPTRFRMNSPLESYVGRWF